MGKRKTKSFLLNIPSKLNSELNKNIKLTGIKKTGFINRAIHNEMKRMEQKQKRIF